MKVSKIGLWNWGWYNIWFVLPRGGQLNWCVNLANLHLAMVVAGRLKRIIQNILNGTMLTYSIAYKNLKQTAQFLQQDPNNPWLRGKLFKGITLKYLKSSSKANFFQKYLGNSIILDSDHCKMIRCLGPLTPSCQNRSKAVILTMNWGKSVFSRASLSSVSI